MCPTDRRLTDGRTERLSYRDADASKNHLLVNFDMQMMMVGVAFLQQNAKDYAQLYYHAWAMETIPLRILGAAVL